MVSKLTLAAFLLAMGTALAPQLASAATVAPAASSPLVADANAGLMQTVQYRGSCRRWREECAARHGWRTRGFFRCVERRGC
jgi:hypothetical protein